MLKPLPDITKPLANSAKLLFELLPMFREVKSSSKDVFPSCNGCGKGGLIFSNYQPVETKQPTEIFKAEALASIIVFFSGLGFFRR
ncbi:hypothetical protein [Bartonella harrusi]|uniref:hypothetical protein n=1 Tax=Bartonella harrusi TaxID=2961895 RepID=UPI0035A88814